MSVYDKRQQIRQQQMDDDPLLKVMYGMQDVDMDAIIGHIKTYNLTETELSALTQVEQDSDAVPKLFLVLFAMWLAPELGLTEGALPRRCEPFVKALPTLCMDMLEGRIVTLQSFVNRAVADYIMGPRAAN
jgi:hypothetical protein